MADGLPKELTSGEKVYINSFLREPPQWIRWVKKTNKKNAIQARLMVVTKYRVFSIKRNKMGKKQIVREAHLFDLKEVSTDDLDRCTLVFKDFKIVAFAPTLGVDLPRVVLQSFYNISFTFSDAAFPKLTMSPEGRSPPNIERTPPGPAAGFEEVYLAQCDYLGVKYSPDIIIMVDDLFASSNSSLDLDQCTGIEKESEYSINLAPVFAALRHNTFFTSFSLHDKSRSETVRGLADVLTHNITLTSVDISGADISSDESWEAFGEAIKSNQRNVLYHMNLSDNQYGEKGVIPVSAAISAIPHAMSSVKASNTGMQAKGITQFFRSLTGNLQLSCALEEVDVSNNSVAGGPLSVAVADWLVAIDAYQPALENKRLRVLNLSACAIDIPPVVDALRNTLYATIQHLDLSNNKIEEYSVQLLATLLGKATALTHLNVSNCGLTAIFLTSLISGTAVNTVMPNFTLDISGNDLSKEDQAIIGMAGAIATCKNIHTLKMGEMNLKRESLIPICKAVGENVTLQGLDFSGNFKHGAVAGKGENPLDLLVNSIKIHPTLTYFGCAGKKDNQLAKDIIPLFKVLVDNNRLLEFDVSHNNFGDDGARELFDTLRTNYCLKTLSFDYNNITYSGWQALRRCIIVNRSLTDIKYPKKDITKTILNAKDKPEMHLKLRELFIDIAIYTHNNLNNQTDERPLQPSPKPPIPTPPFELFLSFASQQFGSSSPAVDYNQRYSQIQPVSQTASLYNIPPVYSSSPTPQTGTYGSPSRPASVMSPPSPSSSSPYMSSPGSHASVYNAPPPPGAFSGSGYDRASTAYDSRSSVYNAPPPPSSSLYNSNGYDEYDASVDLPTRPGGTMRPVSTRAAPPPPPPANPMTVPIPPPLSPSHSTPPTLTPPPPLSTPPSLSTPPMGSRNSSVLSPSLSNKNLPTLPPLPPMPPLPSSPLPSLPGAGSYNNNNSSPATARVPPPPPPGVGRAPPPPPPGDPYEYDENGYQYDSNQYDSSAQYDNSQYDNSAQYDNTQYDNSGYSYDYENQGEEFEDLTPNNNASRNPPPAPHYQF